MKAEKYAQSVAITKRRLLANPRSKKIKKLLDYQERVLLELQNNKKGDYNLSITPEYLILGAGVNG